MSSLLANNHLLILVRSVANLPAEINHLMEEIQAKDTIMADCRSIINSRDSSLQKFIKTNGSLVPNSKEESYNKAVIENLDKSLALQDEKIALAEKASALLDRQVKRLDVKLRDLTKAGILPNDPPLPSLLVAKPPQANTTTAADGTNGIKSANGSASTDLAALSASPANIASMNAAQRLALSRSGSMSAVHTLQGTSRNGSTGAASANGSSAATPLHNLGSSAAPLHLQRQREASASGGNDAKRRRLSSYVNGATSGALRDSAAFNAPTPRAGTPGSAAGGSASQSGSQGPRTTVVLKKNGGSGASGASGGANSGITTSAGGNKKVAPHQQLKKLKVGSGSTKGHKHGSSVSSRGALKVTSASNAAAGRKASGDALSAIQLQSDGDDSILSSPNNSDVDALTATITASSPVIDDDGDMLDLDPEGVEEHVDGEDTKVYCTCRTVSHGDMVACDNEDCPYEWFHWKCVRLTREPPGTWYCEECRRRLGK